MDTQFTVTMTYKDEMPEVHMIDYFPTAISFVREECKKEGTDAGMIVFNNMTVYEREGDHT